MNDWVDFQAHLSDNLVLLSLSNTSKRIISPNLKDSSSSVTILTCLVILKLRRHGRYQFHREGLILTFDLHVSNKGALSLQEQFNSDHVAFTAVSAVHSESIQTFFIATLSTT